MAYTDNQGITYSDDKRTLIKCPASFEGNVIIPKGTLSIGNSAFKGCLKLSALTLPVSLESIGSNAFTDCKTLNNLYYEGSLYQWLTLIDCKAYFDVSYNLWFRENGKYIQPTVLRIPDGIECIRNNAFYYCRSVHKVVFGSGLKKIGDSAFNKISLSTSIPGTDEMGCFIDIPEGVTFIGDYAFFSSGALSKVTIPDSVSHIGKACFSYCYDLDSIKVDDNNSYYCSDKDCVLYDKFKTKLIQKAVRCPFEIRLPKTCREIDNFAFAGGVAAKVYLSDIQVAVKDLKPSKCQFKVPFGEKEKFVTLGFPAEQVSELCDAGKLIKGGREVLSLVSDNPYRVLGVVATASIKDITANATKAKRFANAGKPCDFPTDATAFLGPVKRDAATIENALSMVNLPEDRLRHSLFWLVRLRDNDDTALKLFTSGEIEKLNNFFYDPIKKMGYVISVQLNAAIMRYITNGHQTGAFITDVLGALRRDAHRDNLVSAVCGENYSLTEGEIKKIFIDALLTECDSRQLYLLLLNAFKAEDLAEYVKSYVVGDYITRVNDLVSRARGVDKSDADGNLKAALSLSEKVRSPLSEAEKFLGTNDPQYSVIADSVARQALLCCINYLNNTEDEDAPFNIAEVAFFSEKVAVGKSTKDWCATNVNTLRNIINSRPPVSCKAIESEVKAFLERDNSETLEGIVAFLKESAQYIIRIKNEKESNANTQSSVSHFNGYIEITATRIAEKALSNAIDVVNRKMKYNVGNDAKEFLSHAWEVMCLINSMPLQKEFREKRFAPNNKTIREMYLKVHTPDYSDEIGLPTIGKFGTFRPSPTLPQHTLDIRTEKELYSAAQKDLNSCNKYLEQYPQGKFIKEVLKYKDDLDWQAARSINDYKLYLKNHASGEHITEARQKVSKFENAVEELSKISSLNDLERILPQYAEDPIEEAYDNRFYRLCRSKNDLRRYIRALPAGRHRDDAEKKIDRTYEWASWLLAFIITGAMGALIGGEDYRAIGALIGVFGNLVVPIAFPIFLLFNLLFNGVTKDE